MENVRALKVRPLLDELVLEKSTNCTLIKKSKMKVQ
jgi:hypothetical protein